MQEQVDEPKLLALEPAGQLVQPPAPAALYVLGEHSACVHARKWTFSARQGRVSASGQGRACHMGLANARARTGAGRLDASEGVGARSAR